MFVFRSLLVFFCYYLITPSNLMFYTYICYWNKFQCKYKIFLCEWLQKIFVYFDICLAIIIRSVPFASAWVKSPFQKQATKMKGQTFCFYCCVDEGTIRICFAVVLKNKTKRKNVDSLLFLSTLRRWVFSWALSRKLITWAKCLTLTILAKTSGKIGKCFAFAMSNLRENIFSRLSHFLTFLLFVFVKK